MVNQEVKKAKKIGHIKHRSKPKTGLFIGVLIVLIILALGFYSNWNFFMPSSSVDAIAFVNGVPVLRSTFESQWTALPPQTKIQVTRSQLLDQLISEELLIQKAVQEKIEVSDEEVDNFIASQLAQTGMSLDQYKKLISSQGYSFNDIKKVYKKQLMVAKLFDSTVASNITASLDEIESYYQDHKKDFYHDDEVTVRHILIQVSDNLNDSAAQTLVDKIITSLDLNNDSNFCDLVNNYSMDLGSKDTCGEYTFAKGVMVPEFENASFDMVPGERRVVKSSFGYHIIKKIKDIPASILSLNDTFTKFPSKPLVKDFINQTIVQEKAKKIFDDYVKDLLVDANVVYVDEDLAPNQDSTRN